MSPRERTPVSSAASVLGASRDAWTVPAREFFAAHPFHEEVADLGRMSASRFFEMMAPSGSGPRRLDGGS